MTDRTASSPGMLSHLRVLDLTRMIAGPYCTRLFALYGAEVIKIEQPGCGDPSRRLGFKDGDGDPEANPTFLYLNTGKKSVTLDLKTARGRAAILHLLEQADLLVESFRPGVMERLGLDFATLAASHPNLVVLSLSNFGQTGPYRDFKATELNLQAWAGLMNMVGDAEREPLRLGYAAAEYVAGQNGFAAALAALLGRSHKGRHIDVAIMDTLLTGLNSAQAHYSYNQVVAVRRARGGREPDVHQARDGLVVGAVPARGADVARLSKVINQPLAPSDPSAVAAALSAWISERTREEVMTTGQKAHFAWGALNTLRDIASSPHLAERQFFQSVDHPAVGSLSYAGAPFQARDQRENVVRAPLLGEHTAELLGDWLGHSAEALTSPIAEGAI